jgi:hypothetical protein
MQLQISVEEDVADKVLHDIVEAMKVLYGADFILLV